MSGTCGTVTGAPAAAAAAAGGAAPAGGTTSPSFSPSLDRNLGSFQNLCGRKGGGVMVVQESAWEVNEYAKLTRARIAGPPVLTYPRKQLAAVPGARRLHSDPQQHSQSLVIQTGHATS
jgi:hypothetical protein